MRAAPVGLFFADDDQQRLHVADEQARVTHRDPRARAAAVLVADVVADAIVRGGGTRDDAYFARLARWVEPLDPVLAAGVLRVPSWLAGTPRVAATEIASFAASPEGTGHVFERWHGIPPFATPSALYAFYAYRASPADPAAVLRRSVSVGGDVDSVAAMAGAMVGAAGGMSGLDERLQAWAGRLNDRHTFGRDDLVTLAHQLGYGTAMPPPGTPSPIRTSSRRTLPSADGIVLQFHRAADTSQARSDRPRLATATRSEIQVPPWDRPDSTTPFAPSTARCSARPRSPVRSASTRPPC